MSMPSKGSHTYVLELVHYVQHPVIVPEQAGVVAGLRVERQVAEDHQALPLLSRGLAMLHQPSDLHLAQAASKLHKSSLRLRGARRPGRIVLILCKWLDKIAICFLAFALSRALH